MQNIIKIVEECFDNNIYSNAIRTPFGIDSEVCGKDPFLSELEEKLESVEHKNNSKSNLNFDNIDYREYNKIVDRLNTVNKVRISDAKFLQVLLNICDEFIIDKAVDLINENGLNAAMKLAKNKRK